MVAPIALALLLMASGTQAAFDNPAEPPVCGEVHYSAPKLVSLDERIVITPLQDSKDVEARPGNRSPQGTAKLIHDQVPDFSKAGPWDTRYVVVGSRDRQLHFSVAFKNHASEVVKAQWINDKLLFFRIWWGRVVSTDIIFDIDQRKPIYAEEVDYRDLHECPDHSADMSRPSPGPPQHDQ